MALLDDTRSDWGARPPTDPRTAVKRASRIGVSWHWLGDGAGPSGSHADCLARVRSWQAYHQSANRWKDIGYNVLICNTHGRAIEGRGLDYSGSHSPGVNTEHIGVQFMVGAADGRPSAVAIARAQRLRRDLQTVYPNLRRDWPHRDDPEASTACPGPWLTNWVRSGGPSSPTPQEDDMFEAADRQMLRDILGRVNAIDYEADGRYATETGRYKHLVDLAGRGIDEAALAKALAAELAPVVGGLGTVTVTPEQLETALRSVFGSVDNT